MSDYLDEAQHALNILESAQHEAKPMTSVEKENSDLQKAHYAAAIFAKCSFQDIQVWYVQEIATKYTKHGESEEEEPKSQRRKNTTWYKVTDGAMVKTFEPSIAYLIAKSLERGELL